eukprot:scaffold1782_cov414-Prasinococcus_capsulatus_cf.AAC.2
MSVYARQPPMWVSWCTATHTCFSPPGRLRGLMMWKQALHLSHCLNDTERIAQSPAEGTVAMD